MHVLLIDSTVTVVFVVNWNFHMLLQSSLVAKSDRANVPPPSYADGVYLSEKCRPSAGEHMLLQALSLRPNTTVRDAAHILGASQAAAVDSMEDFIRVSAILVTMICPSYSVLAL